MRTTVIRATKTAGFLLLATLGNPLMAETTTDYSSGWYIGGNIGTSTANIDEDEITQNLTNPSYSDDESDLGYKLFGGYQFNENFALEGGYFNLGKFDYSLSTGTGTADGSIEVMGLNLDIVGILPITENFSAFARVGATYAQAEDSFGGTLFVTDPNPKEESLNYKFGAGLQYAITDAVGVRLEAERYRIDDAVGDDGDIDLVSIGLTYRFGVTKEVAPVSQQEEKVAPDLEEVIVVTAPDARERIRNCAAQKRNIALVFEEINFERDESELSKEAKDSLKNDISQFGENPKIKMRVAGYASASGTKEYNQELSERRAQSVKDYLVEEKLVKADKISVVGFGETRPAQFEAKPSKANSEAAQANMRVVLKITHE